MTAEPGGSHKLTPAAPAVAPVMDVSEVVAAAALAVPGVAALHGGAFGQVASYLPGRSVTGIRIHQDVTEVHVVLLWGAPVLATADRVRATVLPLVGALSSRVDVTVEDVVDPDPLPDVNPIQPSFSGPEGMSVSTTSDSPGPMSAGPITAS